MFKPLGAIVPSSKIILLSSRCLLVVSPFTWRTTNTLISPILLWSGRLKRSATGNPPSLLQSGDSNRSPPQSEGVHRNGAKACDRFCQCRSCDYDRTMVTSVAHGICLIGLFCDVPQGKKVLVLIVRLTVLKNTTQARRVGCGGRGGRGVRTPWNFWSQHFGGVEKIKKSSTQNVQKTVTSRLHGRLPFLPGLSEEAAILWHYIMRSSNLLDWLIDVRLAFHPFRDARSNQNYRFFVVVFFQKHLLNKSHTTLH